jgi:hypothetical protein
MWKMAGREKSVLFPRTLCHSLNEDKNPLELEIHGGGARAIALKKELLLSS